MGQERRHGMFDIHCHIFPAVDDGAGSVQDSIEMAQIAWDSGICGIVATPHANLPGQKNFWTSEMEHGLTELQIRLRELNIEVSLYPGQEIILVSEYMAALRSGQLIGLNRSRYLLTEFEAQETLRTACQKLQQICAEGYVPIVAHPERYGFVQEDPDAMIRLKRAGGLLQLNKGSFQGHFGRRTMAAAHAIMRHRIADFIASDAHSQYRRTTFLAEVHEIISEQYSEEYADLLLEINPEKVIQNLDTLRA